MFSNGPFAVYYANTKTILVQINHNRGTSIFPNHNSQSPLRVRTECLYFASFTLTSSVLCRRRRTACCELESHCWVIIQGKITISALFAFSSQSRITGIMVCLLTYRSISSCSSDPVHRHGNTFFILLVFDPSTSILCLHFTSSFLPYLLFAYSLLLNH